PRYARECAKARPQSQEARRPGVEFPQSAPWSVTVAPDPSSSPIRCPQSTRIGGSMERVRVHLFVMMALALSIAATASAQGGGRQNMPGGQGGGNPPARGGNMPAPTASSSLSGDVQGDWAAQKDLILKAANAMPADKFDAKPTPPQQTFGER